MKKMTKLKSLKTSWAIIYAPKGLYQKTKDLDFLGRVHCNVERLIAGE